MGDTKTTNAKQAKTESTETVMSTAIVEYSATEAVLADLRDRFANVAWDVSTTVGMANAKEARAEINGWLTGLEKERKAQKSEHLKAGKRIDSEAKDIAAELLTLKEPPDKAIKEVEQRKKREEAEAARIEEERVAKCRAEIDRIRGIPLVAVGLDVDQLAGAIEAVEETDVSDLDEFAGVAESALHTTLAKLREMHAEARGRKDQAAKLESERAELEKLRAEQEERDQEKRTAEEKARTEREAEDKARRAKFEADEEEGRRRRAEHENRILEEDRIAREAREKADAEARKLRAAQEADARKAREAEEERQRTERERLKAEREKAEAEERGRKRDRDKLLDGRTMLETFVERFGDVPEFATVAGQIKGYLAASKA